MFAKSDLISMPELLSAYQFLELDSLPLMRERVKVRAASLGLRGTVLLAEPRASISVSAARPRRSINVDRLAGRGVRHRCAGDQPGRGRERAVLAPARADPAGDHHLRPRAASGQGADGPEPWIRASGTSCCSAKASSWSIRATATSTRSAAFARRSTRISTASPSFASGPWITSSAIARSRCSAPAACAARRPAPGCWPTATTRSFSSKAAYSIT
jgi:hypothetical protein